MKQAFIIPAWRLVLLPVLAGMLIGCGSEDGADAISPENEIVSLEDSRWQLLRIQLTNNLQRIPDDPTKYTLRFRSESRLEIESDCNRAGAGWTQSGGQLILDDLFTTRALCQPGTLHNWFVSNLENVEFFAVEDGRLYLTTAAESATLEFEPF